MEAEMVCDMIACIALALSLVSFCLSIKSYNALTVFAEYIVQQNNIKMQMQELQEPNGNQMETDGNRMETEHKPNENGRRNNRKNG